MKINQTTVDRMIDESGLVFEPDTRTYEEKRATLLNTLDILRKRQAKYPMRVTMGLIRFHEEQLSDLDNTNK